MANRRTMPKSERIEAERRFHGKLKRVLHSAHLMHEDWDMDDAGWIVEFTDGRRAALTTSHGTLTDWTKQEAEEQLAVIEASAESIRKAIELWPTEGVVNA